MIQLFPRPKLSCSPRSLPSYTAPAKNFRMSRLLALAVFAALMAGTGTASASPALRAPNNRALRHAGVAVSWPVKGGVAERRVHDHIQVVVEALRSHRAHQPIVGVRLQRVTLRSGRALKLIARRRLRSGIFNAQLSEPPGARYALILQVGSRRYGSDIRTPIGCSFPGSRVAASVTLGRTVVAPGGALTATVHNTTGNCYQLNWNYDLEYLQADGSWTRLAADGIPSEPAVVRIISAHSGLSDPLSIPSDAVPGHYRVVQRFHADIGNDPKPFTATARFDVVAPGPLPPALTASPCASNDSAPPDGAVLIDPSTAS
jgi:hypothetical protein